MSPRPNFKHPLLRFYRPFNALAFDAQIPTSVRNLGCRLINHIRIPSARSYASSLKLCCLDGCCELLRLYLVIPPHREIPSGNKFLLLRSAARASTTPPPRVGAPSPRNPYPRGSHSRSKYLVVRLLHRGRGPSVGVGTRMCPGVPTRVGVVQWPGPDNAGIERKSISLEGNPHSRRQAVSGLAPVNALLEAMSTLLTYNVSRQRSRVGEGLSPSSSSGSDNRSRHHRCRT
jgi:hypothetical protein